jgi:hypothetical protein
MTLLVLANPSARSFIACKANRNNQVGRRHHRGPAGDR